MTPSLKLSYLLGICVLVLPSFSAGGVVSLYTIILTAADALLVAIGSPTLCLSVLSMFSCVVDVLLSIPRYFSARASSLVDI